MSIKYQSNMRTSVLELLPRFCKRVYVEITLLGAPWVCMEGKGTSVCWYLSTNHKWAVLFTGVILFSP